MTTRRLPYVSSSAHFSPDRVHRYSLIRGLSLPVSLIEHCTHEPAAGGVVLFAGLNPSKADEHVDDPTCRREATYARAWGFDVYRKGNLFALRSTDPRALFDHADPYGPENELHVRALIWGARLVICAWGNDGPKTERRRAIERLLVQHPKSAYLKRNKDGSPGHPLYLKKTLQPIPFTDEERARW